MVKLVLYGLIGAATGVVGGVVVAVIALCLLKSDGKADAYSALCDAEHKILIRKNDNSSIGNNAQSYEDSKCLEIIREIMIAYM